MTNHGPMAVEVMVRRGLDVDVTRWVDRYVGRRSRAPLSESPHSHGRCQFCEFGKRRGRRPVQKVSRWLRDEAVELTGLEIADEAPPVPGGVVEYGAVRLRGVAEDDHAVLLGDLDAFPGGAEAGPAPGGLHSSSSLV